MSQKRVLAIHDISCFGRCSLTVALPIISSVGAECTVIPTAVLSTHTGGFTGYTYRDLTDDIVPIVDHWKKLDLRFDAIYTGFLGSFEQIDIVCNTIDRLSRETMVIVDPCMADFGKMYPVFSMEFPKKMRELCAKADIIMPNITEALFLLGDEYKEGPYTVEYIESLLKKLSAIGAKKIILTGVYFDEEKLGAATYDADTGKISYYFREKIEGYYHGTGDVFGSAAVAALVCGRSLRDASRIAVDYTVGSIRRTFDAQTDIRFGVNFEEGIPELIRDIKRDDVAETVSLLATAVWNEHYKSILSQEQIDYMTEKFQSAEAVQKDIDDGFEYVIMKDNGRPVGYTGFKIDGDSIYVSKIYLLKQARGKGIGSKIFELIDDYAKEHGIRKEYLTVNKKNVDSIAIYEKKGFVKVKDVVTDIGNGFVMDDYVMEKNL